MEFKCALFIIVMIVYVMAEENDTTACCQQPFIYILPGKTDLCWDPTANTTTPIRFECFKTIKNHSNFTISDGKIQLLISDSFKPRFHLKLACTGNIAKVKNGSIVKVTSGVLLCQNQNEADKQAYIKNETLGYCMIVSVVFLSITAIIYTLLSELRDLFGKSIINFCISLAIGLGILAILNLLKSYSDMNLCAARGFLCYFFLLAAFFWSNSISIQVLMETRRPCTVDYGWHEFRWFMLYSWLVPALLTICMAIVNYHPGNHDRPGIGLNICWFFNKEQQWYYMYSVMSILLLVNIGIFTYITIIVWRQTFSSSHIRALKFKVSMTIKLIVVMGLSWIFEMIGSLSDAHILWAIMDVFNCMQGVLLFLILVVFRKRVVKVMYKRGWLGCCSGLVERYLAVGDDAEQNVVQHTDIPMSDDRTIT